MVKLKYKFRCNLILIFKEGRDSFYCSSSAATSAGTSTSNNATNNTNLVVNGSECNFSCCTQKKG